VDSREGSTGVPLPSTPGPGQDGRVVDGTAAAALRASLGAQRAHVLGILDGLSAQDLHRPVLPSGWSCLGLVQHLALDVERFWFRAVVAGEQVELLPGSEAWRVEPGTPPEQVLDLYRRETALADAVLDGVSLDTGPAWWPVGLFPPEFGPMDVQRTLLHVIAETACHAGHLDAVRELVDGRTWFVID
jgi:hypothetical protein